ncbi:Glycosyltransferase involved in cell wall bisynthesis [Lentzea albidocapillata subsp. violacea]|uniref:Glycosyltransferase involved in cell wall bisynthesis n=1 Tax=Lentzea albidocapillata subsp. violacea TaxID=128104 RepID=A0A1G9RWC6_9PSEU|nr:glycosyltransferase [Lentzea albidocapillata]SDM27536.1 Glycosyltransferase involved in cell wall bisynthesis [Lentzea albidocapillata subsp. violacea]
MRVGICDFPSAYAFPPYGYGGIERWLWAVAVGAQRTGVEAVLIGPAWRDDLPGGFRRLPIRLEHTTVESDRWHQLDALNLDLLVVGHEYPSLSAWRASWQGLGCAVATFQHDPNFQHAADAFDGRRSRLYCYSPEMMLRYEAHRPQQALSVQFGFGEETPPPAVAGGDLVWIGRIDSDKAPHLAALAAAKLGQRLRIIGPTLDPGYVARHRAILSAPHVELVGELAGADKIEALRSARTMIYTCARDYVEAGAAVFGETLRCGTPVAALVWRAGTCAEIALCEQTGVVAEAHPLDDDEAAAARLAEAIIDAHRLRPGQVQEAGLTRFDPAQHFQALASIPC